MAHNAGWVSVGIDHDTAAFAVESIRRWWRRWAPGAIRRPTALLITADGGGSNGYRVRLWKLELQQLADETGLRSPSATSRRAPASGTRSSIGCSAIHHQELAWQAAAQPPRDRQLDRRHHDRLGAHRPPNWIRKVPRASRLPTSKSRPSASHAATFPWRVELHHPPARADAQSELIVGGRVLSGARFAEPTVSVARRSRAHTPAMSALPPSSLASAPPPPYYRSRTEGLFRLPR